jgi:pimeloyl-ACP methyl ester carboxylesterase
MAAEPPDSSEVVTPLASWERGKGNGSTIVFVHGLDDDSSCWDAVTQELTAHHRCIALDLPGHGDSPRPTNARSYRRDAVLASLDRSLDSIDSVVFVGHSLGGYLGLAHAITRPGVLRGLVLVGSGPGFRDPDSRQRWNDRVLASVPDLEIDHLVATIALHEDSFVIDNLSAIDIPVALVVGSDDRGFVAANDYLEGELTNAERTTVPGARHYVMRTHPVEVAEAILGLVARVH